MVTIVYALPRYPVVGNDVFHIYTWALQFLCNILGSLSLVQPIGGEGL